MSDSRFGDLPPMKVVGEVVDIDYHRNGISGEGFWTIIFRGAPGADVAGELFVATYFGNDEGEVRTAVLRLEALANHDAGDCLRGDHFHDELKALVENYIWPHERDDSLGRACRGEAEPVADRRAAIEHTRSKK